VGVVAALEPQRSEQAELDWQTVSRMGQGMVWSGNHRINHENMKEISINNQQTYFGCNQCSEFCSRGNVMENRIVFLMLLGAISLRFWCTAAGY